MIDGKLTTGIMMHTVETLDQRIVELEERVRVLELGRSGVKVRLEKVFCEVEQVDRGSWYCTQTTEESDSDTNWRLGVKSEKVHQQAFPDLLFSTTNTDFISIRYQVTWREDW